MMKCVNGHEILKGSKFCGECGGAATAEGSKCGHCSSEMVKAAKFCGECGTAAGEPTPKFDEALESMGAFMKASVARESELEVVPLIESSDVDHAEIDRIMAASNLPNEQGNLDAGPIVEHLLKSSNTGNMQSRVYAEHLNAWNEHLSGKIDQLLKAHVALMTVYKDDMAMLKAQVAELSNTPRGRRTGIAAIEAINRPTPAGGADPNKPAGKDALRGPALFAKAELGFTRDPESLNLEETARLESYTTGMNLSLEEIAAQDPTLADRVLKCVLLGEQASH